MNLNQLDIEDVTICLDAILQIGQHHKKFKPESTIGIREWINELGKGYLTDGQINAILTNCKIHKVDVPDCLRAWKEDQDEQARELGRNMSAAMSIAPNANQHIGRNAAMDDLRHRIAQEALGNTPPHMEWRYGQMIPKQALPTQPIPQKPELSDLIALCEHVKEAAMAIASALRNQK